MALLGGLLLLAGVETLPWWLAPPLRPLYAGGPLWVVLWLGAGGAALVGVWAGRRTGFWGGVAAALGVWALLPVHPVDVPSAVRFLLGTSALLLVLAGTGPGLEAWADRLAEAGRRWARLPAGVIAAAGTTLAAAVAYRFFAGLPAISDGFCYRYLARLLLAGHLGGPIPVPKTLAPLVQIPLTGGEEAWSIQHPPGWPALLALGLAAGVPALVNPLTHGLLVLAVHGLMRSLGGGKTAAGAAAWLTALTPFLLLFAGSHMAHTSAAAFLYAGLWAAVRPRPRALGAGLLWGAAFAVRPYTTVLCLLPWLLWLGRRWPGRAWLRVALGALGPLFLLALYNQAVTGAPWRFGYTAFQGGGHALGFGLRGPPGGLTPFTPAEGLLHWQHRLHVLSDRVLLGPLPLLVLLPWAFRGPGPPGRGALLASFLLLGLGHAAYFSRGDLVVDSRFLLEGVPAALMLLALAWGRLPCRRAGRTLLALLCAAVALGVRLLPEGDRMGRHLLSRRDLVRAALAALPPSRAVLFVGHDLYEAFPGLALDPWLESPQVLARQGGAADRRLARALGRPPAYLARTGAEAWVYLEASPPLPLVGPARPRRVAYLGAPNRVYAIPRGGELLFPARGTGRAVLAFGWRARGQGRLEVWVDGQRRASVPLAPGKVYVREGCVPLPQRYERILFRAVGSEVGLVEPLVVPVASLQHLPGAAP